MMATLFARLMVMTWTGVAAAAALAPATQFYQVSTHQVFQRVHCRSKFDINRISGLPDALLVVRGEM